MTELEYKELHNRRKHAQVLRSKILLLEKKVAHLTRMRITAPEKKQDDAQSKLRETIQQLKKARQDFADF